MRKRKLLGVVHETREGEGAGLRNSGLGEVTVPVREGEVRCTERCVW